jgi:hypothetical protein
MSEDDQDGAVSSQNPMKIAFRTRIDLPTVIANDRQKSALFDKNLGNFLGNSQCRNGVTQEFELERHKIPVKAGLLSHSVAPFGLEFDFTSRIRIMQIRGLQFVSNWIQ